jgi:hypothetical protein
VFEDEEVDKGGSRTRAVEEKGRRVRAFGRLPSGTSSKGGVVGDENEEREVKKVERQTSRCFDATEERAPFPLKK